jgi:hypothetical protein
MSSATPKGRDMGAPSSPKRRAYLQNKQSNKNISGADRVAGDRRDEKNESNALADALRATLCAHDLVVRELVVLAIHAGLLNESASIGHQSGHRAAHVTRDESVRLARKRKRRQ